MSLTPRVLSYCTLLKFNLAKSFQKRNGYRQIALILRDSLALPEEEDPVQSGTDSNFNLIFHFWKSFAMFINFYVIKLPNGFNSCNQIAKRSGKD